MPQVGLGTHRHAIRFHEATLVNFVHFRPIMSPAVFTDLDPEARPQCRTGTARSRTIAGVGMLDLMKLRDHVRKEERIRLGLPPAKGYPDLETGGGPEVHHAGHRAIRRRCT
jgi:hypothetical protein